MRMGGSLQTLFDVVDLYVTMGRAERISFWEGQKPFDLFHLPLVDPLILQLVYQSRADYDDDDEDSLLTLQPTNLELRDYDETDPP